MLWARKKFAPPEFFLSEWNIKKLHFYNYFPSQNLHFLTGFSNFLTDFLSVWIGLWNYQIRIKLKKPKMIHVLSVKSLGFFILFMKTGALGNRLSRHGLTTALHIVHRRRFQSLPFGFSSLLITPNTHKSMYLIRKYSDNKL